MLWAKWRVSKNSFQGVIILLEISRPMSPGLAFQYPFDFFSHQLGSFISFILTVLIYPFNTCLQKVVSARGSVWDVCYVAMGPRLFERFDTQDN